METLNETRERTARPEPPPLDHTSGKRNSSSPLSSLFGLNLLSLVAVGIAVSAWLLYYTDIFPEVAGLLGLGGAFAWVAFLSKLLLEKRMKELQTWTDATVFSSYATVLVSSLLALILVVAACFRGGFQLEPFQDPLEHSVVIDHRVSELMHLPAGGHLRWNDWTTWWSPRIVSVKVSGYPEKNVMIRPWDRVPVYIPSSLIRPVVLLRPSVDLIDVSRETTLTLEITILENGKAATPLSAPFDGHALWVGADSDIFVPQDTEANWRQELARAKSEQHLAFWLPPVALSKFNVPLHSGQEIQVVLRKSDNAAYTNTKFKVEPLRNNLEFVQEEVLNVPSAH